MQLLMAALPIKKGKTPPYIQPHYLSISKEGNQNIKKKLYKTLLLQYTGFLCSRAGDNQLGSLHRTTTHEMLRPLPWEGISHKALHIVQPKNPN